MNDGYSNQLKREDLMSDSGEDMMHSSSSSGEEGEGSSSVLVGVVLIIVLALTICTASSVAEISAAGATTRMFYKPTRISSNSMMMPLLYLLPSSVFASVESCLLAHTKSLGSATSSALAFGLLGYAIRWCQRSVAAAHRAIETAPVWQKVVLNVTLAMFVLMGGGSNDHENNAVSNEGESIPQQKCNIVTKQKRGRQRTWGGKEKQLKISMHRYNIR